MGAPEIPSALTAQERTVLDALLEVDFPGVRALRAQAPTVRASARNQPGRTRFQREMVVFEVLDSAAPRARVRMDQPVAARVRGAGPDSAVLLTVRDGRLAALELFELRDELPSVLPGLADLDPPFSNFNVQRG